jgi:hypothetical protein
MGKMTKAATQSARLAVRYGPQAKILWDHGGKQATRAASKRAMTLNARRRALAHASGVVDGSILKIAPRGLTLYVVFTGDQPIAAYPPQEESLTVLLEHADLDLRIRPSEVKRRTKRAKPASSPRELG